MNPCLTSSVDYWTSGPAPQSQGPGPRSRAIPEALPRPSGPWDRSRITATWGVARKSSSTGTYMPCRPSCKEQYSEAFVLDKASETERHPKQKQKGLSKPVLIQAMARCNHWKKIAMPLTTSDDSACQGEARGDVGGRCVDLSIRPESSGTRSSPGRCWVLSGRLRGGQGSFRTRLRNFWPCAVTRRS